MFANAYLDEEPLEVDRDIGSDFLGELAGIKVTLSHLSVPLSNDIEHDNSHTGKLPIQNTASEASMTSRTSLYDPRPEYTPP